jgi:hypothetical protein
VLLFLLLLLDLFVSINVHCDGGEYGDSGTDLWNVAGGRFKNF